MKCRVKAARRRVGRSQIEKVANRCNIIECSIEVIRNKCIGINKQIKRGDPMTFRTNLDMNLTPMKFYSHIITIVLDMRLIRKINNSTACHSRRLQQVYMMMMLAQVVECHNQHQSRRHFHSNMSTIGVKLTTGIYPSFPGKIPPIVVVKCRAILGITMKTIKVTLFNRRI